MSGAVVSWLSNDVNVATVSGLGLVTAVGNGEARITARAGSVSDTAAVTVTVMEPSGEREALTAFFQSTDGPNWTNNSNWLSDEPPGTWHGVRTNVSGAVVELSLGENNLHGQIPSEIAQLQALEYLSLADNRLTGPIPAEVAQLDNLWQLYLPRNQLTGPIPPEIAQLQALEYLSLADNRLTGPIPAEIAQLNNLKDLYLSGNRLTGPIPPEIGQLKELEYLSLSDNQVTGPIPPEIVQLTRLKWLSVDRNPGLAGPLPESMTRLTSLKEINLNNTRICVPRTDGFNAWLDGIQYKQGISYCINPDQAVLIALYKSTGGPSWTNSSNWDTLEPIGEWFGVTTDSEGKVTDIVLENNNLSGFLPFLVGNLAHLRTMNLSFNTGLTGAMPSSFLKLDLEKLLLEGTQVCALQDAETQEWLSGIPHRNVSNCTDKRRDYYVLEALYFSANGPNWTNNSNWLSGKRLSTWHGVSTDAAGRVTGIRLGENNLQGEIPSEIARLGNLQHLWLGRNQLTGPIPAEIGQLQNLKTLDLSFNQLTGPIPAEIGQLQNLTSLTIVKNRLTGDIPSEIGQLQNLTALQLDSNQLTGGIPPEVTDLKNLQWLTLSFNRLRESIPPEIGQLSSLEGLGLTGNRLTGVIPGELGQLNKLTKLGLGGNDLTGEIPSELGNLKRLDALYLWRNQLTGVIPPELGQLENLTSLELLDNELTGTIPSEIGQMQNLMNLDLAANKLTGNIPPEIGQLENLVSLQLSDNRLTGMIPRELGQLQNLTTLGLSSNVLSGEIPRELGQLASLEEMRLSFNRFAGNIPDSFGDLASLRSLRLTDNVDMSGALPLTLVRLNLEELLLDGTMLCVPEDSEFKAWLRTVPNNRVARCGPALGRSVVYLTQATQSLEHPVSLVAGKDALLRVFVTSDSDADATLPLVRATFYQGGAEMHTVDIPGQAASIPREIDEGDLSSSSIALIPGSVLASGLEMVIEIDPEGALDPSLGISGRLPESGRMPVDVVDVPPFELTLVPFLWTENPDQMYLTQIESLTAESDMFRYTRDLLPVNDLTLNVYEPQWISVDPGWEALDELARITGMIRAMAGASGHYMGILRNGGGWGERPGYESVSILEGSIIAHELGHNMNLYHAPCGDAPDSDPDYPYSDGSIGAWGYDLLNEVLVSPDTPDLMGYCRPRWISDYNFSRALGYRLSQARTTNLAASFAPSARSLLLWGGVKEDGEIVLEPAFVVDAPPSLPRMDGDYRITGEGRDGSSLFSLSFGMPEGGDVDVKTFAFIVPVRREWRVRLTHITVSGPEGFATQGSDDESEPEDTPSTALLLDPATGKVRGLLRDWPAPGVSAAAARRATPEPGLKVVISRGVPDQDSW